MKLSLALHRLWSWLPPETWAEVYAVIFTLLLLFLTLTCLFHALKGALS